MTTNKVTKLYPSGGITLNETHIQAHFDAQNADGWNLIFTESLNGWYRFFWEKVE